MDRALQKKNRSIEGNPSRPFCHFAPPAGWMNDPNGTIRHGGYYHLFYQHNPHDDRWGTIHWGHARSSNLVDWEYLPTALYPDGDGAGESSCFSGCCAVAPSGVPTILYTSVGGEPDEKPWDQRGAVSDDEMISWRKMDENPLMDIRSHGGPAIEGDWRDPYLFSDGDKHFLVIGVTLAKEEGGDSAVLLYESTDGEFKGWKYKSVLIRRPKYEVVFFECPNFIPFGDKWLLLTSTYGTVDYYAGDFDGDKGVFTPETHGILDGGQEFYATNTALSPEGRVILFGWMRGFNRRRGWCGQMAFPRELTLDEQGLPCQRPVREIAGLRKEEYTLKNQTVTGEEILVGEGKSFLPAEIRGTFTLEESAILEIRLFRSEDGTQSLPVRYDGQFLDVGGTRIIDPLSDPRKSFDLHIIVDRTLVEVFLDGGRKVLSRGIYGDREDGGVSVRTLNGSFVVDSMTAWTLRPAERVFAPISEQ